MSNTAFGDSTAPIQHRMHALLSAWLAEGAADDELALAATGLDHMVTLVVDGLRARIRLSDRPSIPSTSDGDGSELSITAAPGAWDKVLAKEWPSPGFHSFTAILRANPAFEFEGDPLVAAQCLAALERLFELIPRQAEVPKAPVAERDFGCICGRYSFLSRCDGVISRVYWEESGDGAPILFLHTAGADGRQFHYQMADVGFTRGFRMLAFDVPGHGNSPPPSNHEPGREYLLYLEEYLAWCVAFLHAKVGKPAIIVGGSMGAAMALILAARHPELVAAVIALEAPLRSPGRRTAYLRHAKVNEAMHSPSYVRGLMSPSAPKYFRDEACRIYSQGSSGIYSGDLHFYSEEYNGAEVAPAIAATNMPVELLTGEYDYSATPHSTRALASLIPRGEVTIMPHLGHFPMIENPDLFRVHFAPALARVCRGLHDQSSA